MEEIEEKWACSLCTQANSKTLFQCEICNAERPLSTQSERENKEMLEGKVRWQCQTCTMINDASVCKCSVCETNKPENMQIYIKCLDGHILTININNNDSVEHLKDLIQEKNEIHNPRLIFAGKQLEDGTSLSSQNIQKESTIHMCMRLRNIGIFEDITTHIIVKNNNDILKNYCQIFDANQNETYENYNESQIDSGSIKNLKDQIDHYHNISTNPEDDFKICINKEILIKLISQTNYKKLSKQIDHNFNKIIIRRVQLINKIINIHTDQALKTLRVLLNQDQDGCDIYYINKNGINTPDKIVGSVTVHNNKILHGVTAMNTGVRYTLSLLRNPK